MNLTLKEANMEELNRVYFNTKNPAGFGSLRKLQNETKIKKKVIESFLESQDVYTKTKSAKHIFPRIKISSPYVDYLWQADLITVKKISKQNKGYHYLLTVIDVLSRFAFVRPVKRKTASDVAAAFESILSESGRKCRKLQTDEGLEFFNSKFKAICNKHNILHFHNFSPLKAAMVERFNRTLMTKMYKMFLAKSNYRYIEDLQNLVQAYNHTVHSSTKYQPCDVNKFNALDVWLNSNKKNINSNSTKSKLRVGDTVRIKVGKSLFEKGYTNNFSDSLYTIDSIRDTKPLTYKICTKSNQPVDGIFYVQELSRVNTRLYKS